ncbi:MAG: tetratricopeptide repeat protein [Aestuariivirga sp.]|uniref:tetratricopeptide repeat protein n=1 Tax=Aestuariivirga sp. TaxID=2650926 RepID=UPI0025C0710E|nr:tetratricopeptide repeat protein [Aestuariivirga sp.]MCA3561672.1 tetratricopeptide repeat protein [Aestuariivirga sp.]
MPLDDKNNFQMALALHQRGDLAAAQALYAQVLKKDPRHFDSLHLLGLVLVQSGALAEGVALIRKAIGVRSDFAGAHYNLGHALLSLGHPEEALASFDRALALAAAEPLYHLERGNALKELGRTAEALAGFGQAVRLAPRLAEAHNNMGILLKEEGRFAEALACYDRAIGLRPGYAEAHGNRGNVLKELRRYGEAMDSYDRALQLKPDYAEAYSNRGNALARLGRHAEALESHDKALKLKPDYAEGHSNRGNALKELGRFEEALESFGRAISLKPDYAEAYTNRAGALEQMGRLTEALAEHDKAVALKPGSAEAWCARGNALADLERLDESLASYERAISLKPGLALAQYNASLLLLRRHDFARGFAGYLQRWAAEEDKGAKPQTAIPAWDGGAVGGELLIWGEQGLGDEVFFATLLPLIDPSVKLALSADRRLHPALSRAFPQLTLLDRKDMIETIAGPFAAQAPMGDLGHLLKLDAARIAARRYPVFAADAGRRARVLDANPDLAHGPVCGVSWRSGNPKLGRHRSVTLADFAPLLQSPGLRFVNLQYGEVAEAIAEVENRFGIAVPVAADVDVFHDIEGLLALIDLCDVVFTIDNVTAHLAGALGKPAVVLAPAGNGRHWYWGGESPSLWYPSLQLVYQTEAGDWASAIADGARRAIRRVTTGAF